MRVGYYAVEVTALLPSLRPAPSRCAAARSARSRKADEHERGGVHRASRGDFAQVSPHAPRTHVPLRDPPFLSGCANTTAPPLSVWLSFATRGHPTPCQCECGPLSLVSGLLCGGVVFKKNRSSRQSSRHSRRLLGVTTGIAPAHCGVGVCVRAGGRGGQSPARNKRSAALLVQNATRPNQKPLDFRLRRAIRCTRGARERALHIKQQTATWKPLTLAGIPDQRAQNPWPLFADGGYYFAIPPGLGWFGVWGGCATVVVVTG